MEFHEIANVFPMLPQAELETLVVDIKANGLHHAITTLDGKILDGRNRYAACVMAEVEPRFEEYTGDNPLAFVISENIVRRHLDESQRAMCAARLANMRVGGDRPSKNDSHFDSANLPNRNISQSAAAEMLNVGERSIRSAKTVIANGVPELVQAVDAGHVAVSVAAKIAMNPKPEQEKETKKILDGEKPHVANNSGNNEWYTPSEYIESARSVMGDIDLDPASSNEANEIVKAARYYTIESDGLSKRWSGKVWMNPPYAGDLIGKFTEKLCKAYTGNNITEAIVLVNNATETEWFQSMAIIAEAICFPSSRIRFWQPGGKTGAPLQGQTILYLGLNSKKFAKEFSKFGLILWRK